MTGSRTPDGLDRLVRDVDRERGAPRMVPGRSKALRLVCLACHRGRHVDRRVVNPETCSACGSGPLIEVEAS